MKQATREAYGLALLQQARLNDKIVALDADLSGSTKTSVMAKEFPDRFFNVGIAESNLIGVASGFAASGYIPFASTFAMFASGRAWEIIRNSVAYPHLNVKICATHAGISVGEDGVSHQAIEDIAIMRAIPGMHVYCPSDGYQTKALIKYVSEINAPCYVRLSRMSTESIYDENTNFDFTKIKVLTKGEDLAIFATGIMVKSALDASVELKNEGINATVVDVCSLKPVDEEGILEILKTHKNIVTCEEHNIIGGLGSIISDISTKSYPTLVHKLGVNDEFAESGKAEVLLDKYKLNKNGIIEFVKKLY